MYRVDEAGVLNNYANEPATYPAWYPSENEQRTYVRQGVVALMFIVSLMVVAFGVS